jgi:ADP-ribose pyrophosphatase YjhB (NUDIX family)
LPAASVVRIDVTALLDEVRAIAQTGLHYATDPFDRARYEHLLALASREYADRAGLEVAEVRARFARELGYVTAKVGVDAALFDEHDRILLVRRVDDNRWGLVAGWIDGDEIPEQAIVREIAEEVGLTACVDELVGVFGRSAGVHGNPHSVVSIVYLCHAIGGTLLAQPHEVLEIAWRSIDDVDDWHHHHESLARAALEAHWRRRAGL